VVSDSGIRGSRTSADSKLGNVMDSTLSVTEYLA
jgi:hypothetical protein